MVKAEIFLFSPQKSMNTVINTTGELKSITANPHLPYRGSLYNGLF